MDGAGGKGKGIPMIDEELREARVRQYVACRALVERWARGIVAYHAGTGEWIHNQSCGPVNVLWDTLTVAGAQVATVGYPRGEAPLFYPLNVTPRGWTSEEWHPWANAILEGLLAAGVRQVWKG